MKQCGICGHAAERGSICDDCRAALKRARDATVSQFEGLPALAVATATGSAPIRAVARTLPARVSRPMRTPRKVAEAAPSDLASPLLEVPGNRRGGRFVWVIVTLMVFVVTYVAYGVITTAIEASSTQQAQFAKPEASAPVPLAPVPRAPGADAAVLAPQNSQIDSASVHLEQPAHEASSVAPVRTPARTASRTKESPRSPSVENAGPPITPVMRDSAADTPPPKTLATPTPARSAEVPRVDRWQRMSAAIQSCAGKGFLDGVLCEQKVRLNYCEGWWGQVPQCPGGVSGEHGQ